MSAKQRLVTTALFFLLVTSLRLCLLYVYGFDSPYSDQWDAEGWTWLRPFHGGSIDWSVLFQAHNEHRIALMRLMSLPLFALNNDQWDNLVSATFNVFFVSAAAALAFHTMLKGLAPIMWLVPALLLVALCLPCGHENLLLGFQVEFYQLIMLSVLGVWLAATRAASLKYTLVLGVIAYASLFTLASGVCTPVAIAIAAALRVRATREPWLPSVPLFAVLASATVVGFLLMVQNPLHENFEAHHFMEWMGVLRMVASWPLPASWLSVAILWSPTLLGGAMLIRSREPDTAGLTALAAGAWTAAQIASITYGRAHEMVHLHSRYADILALTVLVNTFFCLWLLRSTLLSARARTKVSIACIWLTVIIGGYAVQGAVGVREMQDFAASRRLQSNNLRMYLLFSNSRVIDAAEPWNLPYPNRERLKMMLDDPAMRDMLPAGIRPPLSLGAYGGGFSVNGLPGSTAPPVGRGAYGSYAPKAGNDNTADMSSGGLHSRFPYLLFSVAGGLGSAGLSLELQPADGTPPRKIEPWTPANESWKEAGVATPAGDFSLHARDDSHSQWFAFTSPVEVGRLSYWSHRLLNASPAFLLLSLLATAFTALFFLLLWLLAADDNPGRGLRTESAI